MNVKSFTYQGFDGFDFVPSESLKAEQAQEFSNEQNVPVPEPVKSLPVYTQEDMELAKTLAREEGIREGVEQGRREAMESIAAQEALKQGEIAELLGRIAARVEGLSAESQGNRSKLSDKMANTALTIARKVCGGISDKTLEAEINAIINEAVSKLDSKDSIKLHISPKNAEYLNDKFTGISVNVDEKLDQGDFRISWNNGYAERDVKKIWAAVEEICSRHSSVEETEQEAEIKTENTIEQTTEIKQQGE